MNTGVVLLGRDLMPNDLIKVVSGFSDANSVCCDHLTIGCVWSN